MKQVTHNNHYVPRLYLKGWSDSNSKIWRYKLLVSHKNVPLWDYPTIESAASKYDLYTYEKNQNETDEFEEWFNKEVETSAQSVFKKVMEGKPLQRADMQILTKYVAAQYVRTPARLNNQLKFYKDTFPTVIQNTMQDRISKLEQILKEKKQLPLIQHNALTELIPAKVTIESKPRTNDGQLKYEVILGRGVWLYEIKHVIQNTSKVLMNHNWEIIRVAQGVNWCTSDDPVICLNYYSPGHYDFGGGWNRNGSEIIFPLTPHHILYTRVGCKEQQPELQENPYFTFMFQKFIFEHAHRYIFSKKPFDSIASCRDRIVDNKQCKEETQKWRNWYEDQNNAERALKE